MVEWFAIAIAACALLVSIYFGYKTAKLQKAQHELAAAEFVREGVVVRIHWQPYRSRESGCWAGADVRLSNAGGRDVEIVEVRLVCGGQGIPVVAASSPQDVLHAGRQRTWRVSFPFGIDRTSSDLVEIWPIVDLGTGESERGESRFFPASDILAPGVIEG
jgi:hypothetical protein